MSTTAKLSLAVITRVPNKDPEKGPIEAGNLAADGPFALMLQTGPPQSSNNFLGEYAPAMPLLHPVVGLNLRLPVFSLGEILVLDSDGREVAGKQRKPGKWDVSYATFPIYTEDRYGGDETASALQRAIELAREVTAAQYAITAATGNSEEV